MLKKDWFAAAEGEIHPRWYRAGEILTGELLERARALGLLDEPRTTKARKAAPENKAQ